MKRTLKILTLFCAIFILICALLSCEDGEKDNDRDKDKDESRPTAEIELPDIFPNVGGDEKDPPKETTPIEGPDDPNYTIPPATSGTPNTEDPEITKDHGTPEEPDGGHVHIFDQYVESKEYLRTPASCITGNEYFLSCVCGESASITGGDFTFFDHMKDLSNHERAPECLVDEYKHWSEHTCCNTRVSAFEYHNWKNGACEICKYECMHEGGTATCKTRAVCYYCESEYGEVNPDAHDLSDGEEVKAPDCVNEGVMRSVCFDCETEIFYPIGAKGHAFHDWSEYEAPTCQAEGKGIRSCEECLFIETVTIPKVGHDFVNVLEDEDNDGNDTVAVVCSVCSAYAGNTYNGLYLKNENAFYLTNCASDFSFDIVYVGYDESPDYIQGFIKDTVTVTDLYYSEVNIYDHPELKIEYKLTPRGGNVYTVTPVLPYSGNRTYMVKLNGDVRFADAPGNVLMFKIAGEEKFDVSYNPDIIFLKALAAQKQLPFEYLIEFDEDSELYGLAVTRAFGFDESYVGKLLCIGDCVNMTEADALPSDKVVIGKIEAISTEYENLLVLALSIPSVDEIYTELNVSGNALPKLDESIVTEEFKMAVFNSVIESEDFAAAIASSAVAANNFAMERGYSAEAKLDFSIDNFKIKVKVTSSDDETAKIEFTIGFSYETEIKDGVLKLGTLKFDFEFNISYAINVEVTSNLDKLFTEEIKKTGLNLDCKVTNTFAASYDMSFELKMDYLFGGGEPLYVVNTVTNKIHTANCGIGPVKPEHYVTVSLAEIKNYVKEPEKHACAVCEPFKMGNGGFIINSETQIIHCVECMHVSDSMLNSETIYKHYPIGVGGKDCAVCKPNSYTKSLDKYLEESVADANFAEMFEYMRELISDRASGKGESPINADTKPKITVPIYCFEMPIYVEPKMDFSLKANFSMHYDFEIKNTICIALVRTDDGYRVIGSSTVGKPKQNIKVDMTGEFKVELGVVSEIRLGVRYLAKQVYIGVLGEAGMYVEANGIYHLDTSKNEHYYAARFEIGYYTEIRCTYKVIGIIRADSFDILEKKFTPIFNSGDAKIYNRFVSQDGEMSFSNTNIYYLDNQLLGVRYYDLKAMENKFGYLNWGEKKQYGFECVFRDENGNTVDYIVFEGGALHVLDGAPDEFTVYMTVTVFDKIVAETFTEYVGKANAGGCAIFLPSKVIKINYKYADTSKELEALKGIYKGFYNTGTNLWGEKEYRNIIVGIHKVSELIEDEELLAYYVQLANFVRVDDNGNPEILYTVEDAKEFLRSIPHEYVLVKYSEPGNGLFDILRDMSVTGIFYDNGIVSNGYNDYFVENADSYSLYTEITSVVPGKGIYGVMYADSTKEEYLGEFSIDLVTDGSDENK